MFEDIGYYIDIGRDERQWFIKTGNEYLYRLSDMDLIEFSEVFKYRLLSHTAFPSAVSILP
jgi:hypothetical protein